MKATTPPYLFALRATNSSVKQAPCEKPVKKYFLKECLFYTGRLIVPLRCLMLMKAMVHFVKAAQEKNKDTMNYLSPGARKQ